MTRSLLAAALMLSALALSAFQTPPARPRVTGIHHVAFRVSDAAEARTFYGQLIGLRERAPSRIPRITYGIGSRQAIVLEPGATKDDDERLLHLAFETPDIMALAAYFAARGIDVRRDARCHDSALQVADPDGHTIEFVEVQWPPPAGGAPEAQALSGRLLHAGLTIRDEQRAHEFYRDALGFLEIWRGGRPEGVTRWVNMRVLDGTDYLEYMLVTTSPDRRERGVLHHVCLRVPDMQAAWEEVARRSVRLKRPMPGPPQIGVNGRYQLNLYDPDGTRVELMEPFTVR